MELVSRFAVCSAVVGAVLASLAQAQVGGDALPRTFAAHVPLRPAVILPAPSIPPELSRARGGARVPFRYAVPIAVDLDLTAHGTADPLPDGGRLWSLCIASPGAKSLGVVLDRFELPEGGALSAYGADRQSVRGAFTRADAPPSGAFGFAPVEGDAIQLEYYEPAGAAGRARLHVRTVLHDFRGLRAAVLSWQKGGSIGFPSDPCEVDVQCPEGAPFQKEKRAVVLIATEDGSLATGALLNNTANDGKPYVLTSRTDGPYGAAVFYFNYENATCGGAGAPATQSLAGSIELAGDDDLDFALLRLTAPIPATFAPYFLGWDRTGATPASTACIHHPSGDAKKVSLDFQPPAKTADTWFIQQWEVGVTEYGSYGAPLLSPEKRCIGHYYDGFAFCDDPTEDEFTRFDRAFGAGLAPILDPLGTGALAIDGYEPPFPCGHTVLGAGAGGSNVGLLQCSQAPVAGSTIAYTVGGLVDSGPAVAIVAAAQVTQSFLGGTLFVPVLPGTSVFVPLQLTSGAGAFSVQVPNLPGFTSYLQVVKRVSSAPFGWYFSNGLATTICPCSAPPAPGVLSATASGPGAVALAWLDTAADETQWELLQIDPGQGPAAAHVVQVLPANATGAVAGGLQAGGNYGFQVRSVNGCGTSPASNVASASVTCPPMNPPSGLVVTAVGADWIQLAWQDNTGSEIAYRVAKLDDGEDPNNPNHWDNVGGDLPANTTSYKVIGLAEHSQYKFKVRAKDACIEYSDYSNVASGTTGCAPLPAPTGLHVTAVTATSVSLAWQDNANGEIACKVSKLDPGEDPNNFAHWDNVGGDLPPNTTSFTVGGLATGATYQFRVRCESVCHEFSPYSIIVSGTPTCSAPPAPSNLVVLAAGPDWILLGWQDNAGDEIAYRVAKLDPGEDPNNFGHWDNVGGDLPPNTTSYLVTGLAKESTYLFRVRCQNGCGAYSEYSNIIGGTTVCPPPPPAPFGCDAAGIGSTSAADVKVTWNYPAFPVAGFRVARLEDGKDPNVFANWNNVGGDLPPNKLNYTDASASLVKGKKYHYKVRAFVEDGPCTVYSEYSNSNLAIP